MRTWSKTGFRHPLNGYTAMAGGAMGLLLPPVMVIIKYMTGWAVIREPTTPSGALWFFSV